MERLTNIGSNGEIWITDNDETRRLGRKESAYKRLAEYEDAEEKGLLLKLPCKVGDTVYLIKPNSDRKIIPRTADMMFLGVLWEDYGKEWFLTKEEAEQKLKEVEA